VEKTYEKLLEKKYMGMRKFRIYWKIQKKLSLAHASGH